MKRIVFITLIILLGSLLVGCKKENKGAETEDTYGDITVTPTITKELEAVPTKDLNETPTPTLLPTPSSIPYDGPIAGIMTKEDYPVVDGSTATIPLSEAVYSLATGATATEASNEIIHTRTSNAYYRLAWKEVDLLIVYAPSEEVIEDLKKGGYKLNMKPIGKDALVFMANASNPVESLTHEQLVDIYSGKITDWSQVGGLQEELLAFQRPTNSGSQTLMQKLVMKDTSMIEGPNVLSFESMEGILKAMVDYSNEGNTLGYSVFYYAKNMYQMPELKFMKVNDIEPSLNSIYDNSYPYINEFYAVIRENEPENSNARKIFDWLTSVEGQGLVKELGYVPVAMKNAGSITIDKELPSIPLGEGNCFITTSYSNYLAGGPIGTVTIYKDNWEILRVFHNASVSSKGMVPKNSVISLAYTILQGDGSYQLKAGLYSLADEKFITPIEYDKIAVLDDRKGYYIVTKSEEGMIIDQTGKELVTDLSPNLWVSDVVGEEAYRLTYTDSEWTDRTYYCFDEKLKLIYSYRDKYYSDFEMHDSKGNLILSKDLFYEAIGLKETPKDNASVYSYMPGDQLIVADYNRDIYLLDTNKKIIEHDKFDDTNPYYAAYGDIYLKGAFNEEKQVWMGSFHNKKGNPITDTMGRTYGDIYAQQASDQILYEAEDGILRIYFLKKDVVRELEIGNWTNVILEYVQDDITVVYGSIGSVETNWYSKVFRENELLYDLEGIYISSYINQDNHTDHIMLQTSTLLGDGSLYLILDSVGNTLYESIYPEEIISVDEELIQLKRGNYNMVIDYAGNIILREIKNELGND